MPPNLLNVESNNFRKARSISVIHSSNDAASQKELGFKRNAKNLLSGELRLVEYGNKSESVN